LLLVQPAAAQTLFTDVAEQFGLSIRNTRNVVSTNYDNDGFLDMFLTENRFSPRQIALFHNTGDDRFVDQTFSSRRISIVREAEPAPFSATRTMTAM
jgi:hypothetical protein